MPRVFTKTQRDVPPDFFEAEARGLHLLRVPGGPPIPEVLSVEADRLILEWIEPGRANAASAREFGRALAAVHQSGGDAFGAPQHGYIATLPQDNTLTTEWPEFYVE